MKFFVYICHPFVQSDKAIAENLGLSRQGFAPASPFTISAGRFLWFSWYNIWKRVHLYLFKQRIVFVAALSAQIPKTLFSTKNCAFCTFIWYHIIEFLSMGYFSLSEKKQKRRAFPMKSIGKVSLSPPPRGGRAYFSLTKRMVQGGATPVTGDRSRPPSSFC